MGLTSGEWQPQQPVVFLPAANGQLESSTQGVTLDQDLSILKELGCLHAVVRDYIRPQRKVRLTMLAFPDGRGSFGAYSTMRHGSSTVFIRGDGSSEDDQSISFWQGRYFITVTTSTQEDDTSKDLVRKLADQLPARIKEHAMRMPQIINHLPVIDRLAGSEKLFCGGIAARRFVAAPSSLVLFEQGCVDAAFADYQFARPDPERMKLLLINYGDRTRADAAFHRYAAALATNYKSTEITSEATLYKTRNGFLLCKLNGNYLAVISGARKKSAPFMLERGIR